MINHLLISGWITFASLQGIDLISSHRNNLREANPLMNHLLSIQIAIKSATTTGLIYSTKKHTKFGNIVVWTLNGLYTGVVIHNFKIDN